MDKVAQNHEKGMHYTLLNRTNEIREKKSGDDVYERIKKSAIKLRTQTGAMVQIIEIPPQSDVLNETEIEYTNKRIKGFPIRMLELYSQS